MDDTLGYYISKERISQITCRVALGRKSFCSLEKKLCEVFAKLEYLSSQKLIHFSKYCLKVLKRDSVHLLNGKLQKNSKQGVGS